MKAAPGSYEAWFNLGLAYQKTNRREQAGQAYAEAIKIRADRKPHTSTWELRCRSAAISLKPARLTNARSRIAPEQATARWNLSIVQERLGSVADAEKCVEKVLEVDPEKEDAWFRLGYFRLVRADYAESIEPFRICVAKKPDWLEALINLGLAQWRSGDLQAAKASYVQAIAKHEDSNDALRALAALAVEMNDHSLALDIESKLEKAGESAPELAYNIGIVLERANLFEDAARCYRHATERKPDFGEALLNLGHALNALGQGDEARACWQKALEAKPELAEKYF